MELIINKAQKEIKPTNIYEVIVKFMEGDADGYNYHTIRFHENELKNPEFKKEFEDFYKHIKACIQFDSGGRGGFYSERELTRYYKDAKGWLKFVSFDVDEFLDDEDLEEDEFVAEYGISIRELSEVPTIRQKFIYDVPTYADGWYDSYKGIYVYYYDENGDKCSVTVQD